MNIDTGKWYMLICESGEKFVGLVKSSDDHMLVVTQAMQIFTEVMRLQSPAGPKAWTTRRVLALDPEKDAAHYIPRSRILRLSGPVSDAYVQETIKQMELTSQQEEEDRQYAQKGLKEQEALFNQMRAAQETGLSLPGMPPMEDPRRRRA